MPESSSEAEKTRLLEQYLSLSGQIKFLESELDKVKDAIRGWLDEGELVSDGKQYATYQKRVTYEYDDAEFKSRYPMIYERVVSVDSKKIKSLLDSELIRIEDLDQVRSPKETLALVIRSVER